MFKTGIGIAMRPFVKGRQLILGGAKIDHPMGLEGNSYADVLCYAIIDALLGASNLGEMNELFPEDDIKYKDISGLRLLELVNLKLARISFAIENIDVILACSEIDLAPYKTYMLLNLSHALKIDSSMISLKQSGSFFHLVPEFKKGISAFAVCTIIDMSEPEEEEEESSSEEEYYE
ncbi:MAG TPA: 2-C-methyl-D-erythritol 2,4-cyclodiphosphate synthase [candidate division Zixibacteria bacterium]|nr:2-C-methyl-D-erythritol 2,4-cyclodiphosphate synthase [candidate division Zixibacteria bacterium]